MVSVAVIQDEIGALYSSAGATSYFLVNTSDIRPVAMTTRAVMEMAWGGVPATIGKDEAAADADAAFYRRWADGRIRREAAPAIAVMGSTSEYFAAPSLRSSLAPPGLTSAGNAPPPRRRLAMFRMVDGDQHYHSEIRRLILDELSEHQVAAIPSQSPKWTRRGWSLGLDRASAPGAARARHSGLRRGAAALGCGVAACGGGKGAGRSRSARVLPGSGADMITINRESNRALLLVAHGH